MTRILAALRSRWTWIALAAVALAGAGGYAAGRYAAPAKVVETSSTTTAAQDSSSSHVDTTAAVQYRYGTETQWVSQAVIAADVNTRCTEKFDPASGRLVRRVCVRVDRSHVDTSSGGASSATAAGASSSSSSTSSASASSSSTTSTTTKVVEAARPQWALEVGASWDQLAERIRKGERLAPPELELALGRRILGPVWLAATVGAPTGQLGNLEAYRVGLRARGEW